MHYNHFLLDRFSSAWMVCSRYTRHHALRIFRISRPERCYAVFSFASRYAAPTLRKHGKLGIATAITSCTGNKLVRLQDLWTLFVQPVSKMQFAGTQHRVEEHVMETVANCFYESVLKGKVIASWYSYVRQTYGDNRRVRIKQDLFSGADNSSASPIPVFIPSPLPKHIFYVDHLEEKSRRQQLIIKGRRLKRNCLLEITHVAAIRHFRRRHYYRRVRQVFREWKRKSEFRVKMSTAYRRQKTLKSAILSWQQVTFKTTDNSVQKPSSVSVDEDGEGRLPARNGGYLEMYLKRQQLQENA